MLNWKAIAGKASWVARMENDDLEFEVRCNDRGMFEVFSNKITIQDKFTKRQDAFDLCERLATRAVAKPQFIPVRPCEELPPTTRKWRRFPNRQMLDLSQVQQYSWAKTTNDTYRVTFVCDCGLQYSWDLGLKEFTEIAEIITPELKTVGFEP